MTDLGALALSDILGAFDLRPIDEGRYEAGNVADEPGVVFGGQLIAQSLVAAARENGMPVKTVHTVFPRPGAQDHPVDIVVEPVHAGRTFASSSVTIAQGDRPCARSLVLLTTDEDDLVRHATPAPAVEGPDTATPSRHLAGDWEVRTVDGVDIDDPQAVGPPRLDVWTRFRDAPTDPLLAQALLAFASDGFLIATAMRPHPGVGQALAHVTLATGVVSHTLTFHEPFAIDEWLLLRHESPYAGRGRSFGRADVFTAEGALVASFNQDAMLRAMPDADRARDSGPRNL